MRTGMMSVIAQTILWPTLLAQEPFFQQVQKQAYTTIEVVETITLNITSKGYSGWSASSAGTSAIEASPTSRVEIA